MSRADLLYVLDSLCSAFAERDREGVMRLLAPDAEVVMVTSEKALLRGHDEVRRFLDDYVRGSTTYSWEWERHDASVVGPVGWLLAEGVETATSGQRRERHPYRMTIVCEHRDGSWMLRQVHGSSPSGLSE
jgi:uncharacterized protein (TIGR02246 family)